MKLWEVEHPYHPADGYHTEFDSFTDLVDTLDVLDPDLNFIYRWDWYDPDRDEYASDDATETLSVHTIQPRRAAFSSYECPITKADEPRVRRWLAGTRAGGYIRQMWAPLLDKDDVAPSSTRKPCSVCGRNMLVKNDGTIRHHGGPEGTGITGNRAFQCDGVGKPPREDGAA